MKRKLVKQGESTLMVSLPSKWIKQFNLKKGNEIELEQKDNVLTISTTLHKEAQEVAITFKDISPYTVKRYLSALYRVGYDSVRISYSDPELIRAVQEISETQLIGYEVVDHSSGRCTIKDLSGPHEEELDSTMRRVFMLLINISRDSYTAILKQDHASLRNVQYMDKSVNKFTNYCRRILSVNGHPDYKKTIYYYQLMVEVENISDEFNFLADHVIGNNVYLEKELAATFKDISSIVEQFYKLFLKFNLAQADALQQDITRVTTKINETFASRKHDMQVLNYLENITRRTSATLGVLYAINA